jgi:hypothetical protein
VLCAVCCVLCAVCCVLCAVCLCAVCCVLCAVCWRSRRCRRKFGPLSCCTSLPPSGREPRTPGLAAAPAHQNPSRPSSDTRQVEGQPHEPSRPRWKSDSDSSGQRLDTGRDTEECFHFFHVITSSPPQRSRGAQKGAGHAASACAIPAAREAHQQRSAPRWGSALLPAPSHCRRCWEAQLLGIQ